MRAKKRSAGAHARSSNKNKRTFCAAGERTESLISGDLWDSKQGVWSELSEQDASSFSKSVVSLVVSDGDTVLFASSGVAIECHGHVSRFLTSASLFRALDNEEKHNNEVKIEVRHEGMVVTGFLEEYDLDYEIAVVKITSVLDVQNVFVNPVVNFPLHSEVVAVGHDIFGKIMATSGELTYDPRGYEDCECLMFSTCKLSEAWEGGPLFDFFGDFVGMNLFYSMGRSFFLPKNIIIERLQHFRTSQQKTEFLSTVKDLKAVRVGERVPDYSPCFNPEDAHTWFGYEDYSLGYPRPSKSGMVLSNCFEEPFGDLYRNGVWKQLSKRVSKGIFESTVSLASFKGGRRFFACTGTLIDWYDRSRGNGVSTILTSASLVRNSDPSDGENKIVDGLTIEVRFPEGPFMEGTLIHYNLHYNVALVSVQYYSAIPEIAVRKNAINLNGTSKVVAIGRVFLSDDLMASSGNLVGWSGSLPCKLLRYSTCKITKAGIGGPLYDFDGKFVGMNFYDPKMGTPFLSCDDIVDILECFKGKRTGAEADNFSDPNGVHGRIHGDDSVNLNWWLVPWPYWRHQNDPEKSCLTEYERNVVASGRKFKYQGGFVSICK